MKKPSAVLLSSFCFFLIMVILVSCSKEGGSNSTAINVANISGTYKLTGLTVQLTPLPPQSILDSIPDCQRDDLIKLNHDMSLYLVDNGVTCVPPANDTSTWSLNGNTITIDTLTGTIQKYDGQFLIINSTIDFNGFPVVATETLTKQ